MSKNFLEVLDSLPKDQQQTFIDHFVQTLNGGAVEPLIMPKSFTVANEGTIEDRISHMASIYGIDPKSINREEFCLLENEVIDSKILIMELIKNHLDKNTGGQRNKNDELLDLGKFLYTSNYNLEIQQSEKPDFILTGENKTIGLEHTRLIVSKDKAFFNELWKEYIQDALKVILTEHPDLTGIVNLVLDVDLPIKDGKSLKDFKESAIRKKLTIIHKSIAEYIIAFISGNTIAKPAFIKSFNVSFWGKIPRL